jgi:hypothetical protein
MVQAMPALARRRYPHGLFGYFGPASAGPSPAQYASSAACARQAPTPDMGPEPHDTARAIAELDERLDHLPLARCEIRERRLRPKIARAEGEREDRLDGRRLLMSDCLMSTANTEQHVIERRIRNATGKHRKRQGREPRDVPLHETDSWARPR